MAAMGRELVEEGAAACRSSARRGSELKLSTRHGELAGRAERAGGAACWEMERRNELGWLGLGLGRGAAMGAGKGRAGRATGELEGAETPAEDDQAGYLKSPRGGAVRR